GERASGGERGAKWGPAHAVRRVDCEDGRQLVLRRSGWDEGGVLDELPVLAHLDIRWLERGADGEIDEVSPSRELEAAERREPQRQPVICARKRGGRRRKAGCEREQERPDHRVATSRFRAASATPPSPANR